MFSDISPLVARAVSDTSTGKHNWHNWQTCKTNTTCKVLTILVFTCGCLFWAWLLCTLFRYVFLGFPAREAFFCFTKKPVPQENQQPFSSYQPNPNLPYRQAPYHPSPYSPPQPYYPSSSPSPPGYDRNLDPFQPEQSELGSGARVQEPSIPLNNLENQSEETVTGRTDELARKSPGGSPMDLGGQDPRKF